MVTTSDRRLGAAADRSRREAFRRHANLCVELAVTQFKLKYTGSALGYAWSLLKPLGYFGIMYLVFVSIFRIGNDTSPNFATQLLLGIVVWTFFQEATAAASNSIVGAAGIIRKASFPRVILVVASTLTASITFLINLALVIGITAALGQMHLGLRSLAALPLIAELYILALGAALILASVCVYYRDVGHLWEIFSQVMFYGSAVVFPIVLLKGKYLPRLVPLNPVAQIIEDMRRALVISDPRIPWTAEIEGWLFLVPLGIVLALLLGGLALFRRLAPRFAEVL